MNRISEEQFYDLLSRKLSGDATSEELLQLQEQLALHPQWQFLYDQMMQPVPPLPNAIELTEQAFAAQSVKMQLLSTTLSPVHTPAPRSGYRKMAYWIAAAIVLPGAVITFFLSENLKRSHKANMAFNEIVTKKGSRSNIKLPDGTQVWLNADSKLTYKENFSEDNREVSLTGEAYFDVHSDRDHPFIIDAGHQRIKVLGTALNVRNYPQDDVIETVLLRGKIEVSFSGSPENRIVLRPLEKLSSLKKKDSSFVTSLHPVYVPPPVRKQTQTAPINAFATNDSVVVETAWLMDKMVFMDQPLWKIARELERHFAVTIRFENHDAETYRYTGVFDNISLDMILQILRESKKISYRLNGKTVTIE